MKGGHFGKHRDKNADSYCYFHHKRTLAQTCHMSWHYLQWQRGDKNHSRQTEFAAFNWMEFSHFSQTKGKYCEASPPHPRKKQNHTHTNSHTCTHRPPRRSLGGEWSFYSVLRLQGHWTAPEDRGGLGGYVHGGDELDLVCLCMCWWLSWCIWYKLQQNHHPYTYNLMTVSCMYTVCYWHHETKRLGSCGVCRVHLCEHECMCVFSSSWFHAPQSVLAGLLIGSR